ncbi:MAG: hypothetical protein R6U98_09260 [Pirellulaceae bacterium]
MSTEAFEDLLQRARSELTAEEQKRLAEQLSQSAGKAVAGGMDSETGKSLYDALNERGMIGSIVDGPGDLSTNPRHMEGCGQDGE